MNSLVEISDTQAASGLLGMEAGICSEIFSVYDANSYTNYIWDEMKHNVDGIESEASTIGPNDDESMGSLDEFIDDHSDGQGDGNSLGNSIDDGDAASEAAWSDVVDAEMECSGMALKPSWGVNNMDGCVTATDNQDLTTNDSPCLDDHDNEDEDSFDNLEQNHHIDDSHKLDCPFEVTYQTNGPYGSCPLYKVTEQQGNNGTRLEPVPYPALYRYRGRDLKMLNRYEYCSLVRTVKSTGSIGEDEGNNVSSKKTGRKKSRQFQFDRQDGQGDMPIRFSHHQILRSKQCTLKFVQNPPRHPGPEPVPDATPVEKQKWRKRANRFAAYYLVLFRPEEKLYESGQVNPYMYNWEEFLKFCNQLKSSKYEIDRLRFEIMERTAHGWRTKLRNRAILSKYRNRSRTIWTRQEQNEAQEEYGKSSNGNSRNYEGDDVFEEYGNNDKRDEQLTMAEERRILGHVSYSDDITRTLESTVGSISNKVSVSELHKNHKDKVLKTSPAKFRFAATLRDTNPDEDEQSEDEEESQYENCATPSEEEVMKDVETFLDGEDLSEDKAVAVNMMLDHYKVMYYGLDDSDYTPPVTIITGGPGTGKSYLVKVLGGVSDKMRVGKQLRAAYCGIAAVNIDGYTLVSHLDIPTDFINGSDNNMRPWNPDKLEAFKKKYDVDRISAVIIDEISTVKPRLVGYLNKRLREARPGIDKPFGGLAVLFIGDFDQLPPVGGDSIPKTIMDREEMRRNSRRRYVRRGDNTQITTAAGMGANLFKNAGHIRLTTQHRSEDDEHTSLLGKMSAGESIDSEDLQLYKSLSEEDNDFRFATILVSGNRERHEMNMIQSKKWADHYRTNLVRWKRRIRDNTWKGKPKNPQTVERLLQESCFWETFSAGALGFLTVNINTDLGLANGTQVRYHSISFAKEEDTKDFNDKVSESQPGEVIELRKRPDIINVELFPDVPGDSKKQQKDNERKRREWKYGSITDDGKIVIPITPHESKHVKWHHEICRGFGGGYRCRPSKVDCTDHFPIEPAFAVTLHKAQGRTIGKVILSLSEHPNHLLRLKWEALYVGLSRVRHRDDIRILVRSMDRSTLDYISDLKKDKHVKDFFNGFPHPPIGRQSGPVFWDRNLAAKSAGYV